LIQTKLTHPKVCKQGVDTLKIQASGSSCWPMGFSSIVRGIRRGSISPLLSLFSTRCAHLKVGKEPRHAGLTNDGAKQPAFEIAGVGGHRHQAGPAWMLAGGVEATGVVVLQQ
jgi:hypothetical protein